MVFNVGAPRILWSDWTRAPKLLAQKIKKQSFQDKYRGHDERWRLIEPHLPPPGSWVLDVGANLGRTVEQVAASGRYSLGLEVDENVYLRWLSESAPAINGGGIIRTQLSIDDWPRIPRFDVVLLFSVLHRIWALQGADACAATLQGVGSRCDLIFVESATRRARFLAAERMLELGDAVEAMLPSFTDNDWHSSAKWHLDYFAQVLPSHRAVLLGRVEHTEKEPFRPVFVLRRIGDVA